MKRRTYVYITAFLLVVGLGAYFAREQSIAARRLAAWNEQRHDAEILVSLDKPTELADAEPAELDKFAQRFSEQTGFEVVIDTDALQLAGITSPLLIDFQPAARRLPAAAQLTLALAQHELCWTVRGGQIVITTPEKLSAGPFVVATYPLPQPELAENGGDSNRWADVIRSVIEPDNWDDVGGAGHCEPVPGALIVVHRPEVHRQVRALLERLQAAGEEPASWAPVPIGPDRLAQANASALARLRRPASIDCREMPLGRLIDFLATEHNVPLVIDKKKVEAASVKSSDPVTKTLRNMSLASLLRHVLKDFELTYTVRDGAVLITTAKDSETQLTLVGYPVHDLIAPLAYQKFGPKYRDYDSLIELITSTIRPDSWDDVGGPGPIDSIGGWLFVAQTDPVHQQIESLLNDIRRTLAFGEPTQVFVDLSRREREQRIHTRLDQSLALQYLETPLTDCLEDIGNQFGMQLQFSRKQLEEVSVSPDVPITGDFPRAPAGIQLRRILEPLELTFTIRDDALVITSPEDAENELTTRVYDVRSLLDNDVGLFRTNAATQDIDGLIEMITGQIRPDTWDDVGGPGAIDVFRGLAVVSQTQEAHDELAGFLAELRRAMRWRDQPQVMPPTKPSAAETAIFAALEHEITLDYRETPLREVIRDIARRIGAPVHLHQRKLDEAGVFDGRPITGHFPAAPARVQLARLLDPLELRFDVRDDWIVITTPEDIESRLTTRIYDVRSLVFPAGKLDGDRADHDTLIELVTSHVQPDSWDDVGGPGAIDGIRGVLAVSNTHQTHRELSALLDSLHRIRDRSSAEPSDLPDAIWTSPDPLADRLYQRLAESVEIVLSESRLEQALQQIARQTGLPIRLDRPDLSDALVASPSAFSINDGPLTIASVFARLLPEGTGYAIASGELLVTLAERCEAYPRLRLYRVADLLAPADRTAENVRQQIMRQVASDRWEEAGGPSSISTVGDQWLLVTADVITHQRLDDWLVEQCTGQPPPRAIERLKQPASGR